MTTATSISAAERERGVLGQTVVVIGSSAAIGLETARRARRRGRVVGPADVAALAVHLMTKPRSPGATYNIDGGQQRV